MKVKILNLLLRFLTLGGKFLLSIYIVKYLGLEVNGEYGIFVTTITLLTYILGVDFYTYSTREILQNKEDGVGDKLRDQLFLFIILYVVVLPTTFVIWLYEFVDTKYFILFYLILIAEHISTEIYRILVIFSKPVMANLNLFLRSGIWIYLLVPIWIFGENIWANLDVILKLWLSGSILSIIVSLIGLAKLNIFPSKIFNLNWNWIKKGVAIAFPFFVGTLSYKVIQFADRYMVDYYLGTTDTGAYIFFSNISMLIETFVQTTVVMIFSPKLVSTFSEGREAFNTVFSSFKKELIIYTLIAVLGVSLLIYPLLVFVEKNELISSLDVFGVMVFTKLIFNFSLLYHFYLYVSKNDKIIMFSTILAVIINLVLNFILIPMYGMLGAALATFVGFFIIFVMKFGYAKKHGL